MPEKKSGFSKDYKPELKSARKLLKDKRSRQVFDKTIELYDVGGIDFWFMVEDLIAAKKFKPLPPADFEQYHHPFVPIEQGDILINAGAGGVYWFKNALSLSDAVGPDGKIIGFEPDPTQFEFFKDELAEKNVKNADLYQLGLWDKPDTMTFYLKSDGASSLVHNFELESIKVDVVDLDSFCKEHNIDKIDFIKMDIEGAEQRALKGAENILRTHKPKLAISVYHRMDDLFDIILYLDSLDLGYEFWMDSHDPNFFPEIILYAKVL